MPRPVSRPKPPSEITSEDPGTSSSLMRGVRDEDQIWAAAHVDEDWNVERWGADEEVAARRAARLVDFRAAARILKARNPPIG